MDRVDVSSGNRVERLELSRKASCTVPLHPGSVFSLHNDIFQWARDHPALHKYSETDVDPHNDC